jgi:hypothetical protein
MELFSCGHLSSLAAGDPSLATHPLVIGGLFTDMLLSLHVFPLIVERVYGKKPKAVPTSGS